MIKNPDVTLRVSVEHWRALWRHEGGVQGRLKYLTKIALKEYPDRIVIDTKVVKPNQNQPLYAVHFWFEPVPEEALD